jgi:hypothetical protein
MHAVWQADSEALLGRLEDELTMERLWREEVGVGPPPHPRASGMIRLLRASPGSTAVIDAVLEALALGAAPDLAALRALTRPASLRGADPRLLHHLAVYHGRVADAWRARAPAASGELELRALAAWLALREERSYLGGLGRAVLGQAAGDEAVRAAIDPAVWAPLERLGTRALRGARRLSSASSAAFELLGRVTSACVLGGCSVGLQKQVEARAERLRAAAVEEALGPVGEALTEATAAGRLAERGPALMQHVALVWRWSAGDEHVERFAVDRAMPIAWELYRDDAGWQRLRLLLAPIEPLVDRLAGRVEHDRARLAYAAPVAQMMVFRAELAPSLDEQRRHAERAVALCPSHRNGRLVLAALLVQQASERLARGIVLPDERARLRAELDRAAALYARTTGLDELYARLDAPWWR